MANASAAWDMHSATAEESAGLVETRNVVGSARCSVPMKLFHSL